MKYFMFSMDGEKAQDCARDLKKRGFSAVVCPPDKESADAVLAEGMEVWGCVGAFSVNENDPQEYLAQDAFGESRRWFNSGCPNEKALWERGFSAIEKWKSFGATKVFADGARFASPCPGDELFLSCFCPRCMALGAQMGFDMPKMREDVRLYAKTPEMPVPQEWLRFREECAKRWFDEFTRRVNEQGMESASFIFTPGLSALVGQTAKAVSSLSAVSPMIYRRYEPRPGIATLNAEYASFMHFYAQRGDKDAAQSIKILTGTKMPFDNSQDIWQNGFEPDVVGEETARAVEMYDSAIVPILQLDDSRLAESIESAKRAGACAIGFFAYSKEGMDFLPPLDDFE